MSDEVLVDIAAIEADLRPASEMRIGLDREAIAEYAAAIDRMPPVKLVFDGEANVYWVADGAHTITAAWKADRREVSAIVVDGSYLDAFKIACASNGEHGVRLTNEDKQKRVDVAIRHPLMANWSDGKVADWCAIHQTTITDARNQLKESLSSMQASRLGKDGKWRRPRSRPKPPEPPEPPPESPSNGEATIDPEVAIALESKPPEDIGKAAEKWWAHVDDADSKARLILSSLERRGGIKTLTARWSRESRERFAESLRALVESYQRVIAEFEEIL